VPIMMRVEGAHHCPVVLCDCCGGRIEDAEEGLYLWQWFEDGGDAELYFAHKRCSRRFEREVGGDEHWLTTEMSCLPLYLGRGLRVKWRRAKGMADLMARV
jgi:hypothetical protein